MDDIGALIFIAAMIWSIIGGAISKKKEGPSVPPPPRRDGTAEERVGATLPAGLEPAAADSSPGGRASPDASAAEMIPDDLWAILTGEQRSPGASPGWGVEEDREEAVWDGPPADAEYREEARSLEMEPYHEAPIVVSMETPPPPTEVRHRQFHERLEQAAVPRSTARRRRAEIGVRRLSELRRAIVLREVLGPPKGLE